MHIISRVTITSADKTNFLYVVSNQVFTLFAGYFFIFLTRRVSGILCISISSNVHFNTYSFIDSVFTRMALAEVTLELWLKASWNCRCNYSTLHGIVSVVLTCLLSKFLPGENNKISTYA